MDDIQRYDYLLSKRSKYGFDSDDVYCVIHNIIFKNYDYKDWYVVRKDYERDIPHKLPCGCELQKYTTELWDDKFIMNSPGDLDGPNDNIDEIFQYLSVIVGKEGPKTIFLERKNTEKQYEQ